MLKPAHSNESRSTEVLASAAEAIGLTPLVALDRITAGMNGRILAKLEMLNPGCSKKDRPALQIILDAEKRGDLKPAQTVVEATSGNMGTGLAVVCATRGYPFVAVMSKGNSPERARMMRALGAEVVLVDQAPGSKVGEVNGADIALVLEEAERLAAERHAFRANQLALAGNFRSHYLGTGTEIWRQSGGSVQAFCDFVGTGGTYGGCTTFLKEQDPAIRCYVIEPEGAAVLAGKTVTNPGHPIQGGGYSLTELGFIAGVPVDGFLEVSGEMAIECARRLAREEGLFAGFSSGANLAGALQLLEGPERGKTVAIVLCDSGLKYLSTDLWP